MLLSREPQEVFVWRGCRAADLGKKVVDAAAMPKSSSWSLRALLTLLQTCFSYLHCYLRDDGCFLEAVLREYWQPGQSTSVAVDERSTRDCRTTARSGRAEGTSGPFDGNHGAVVEWPRGFRLGVVGSSR